MHIHRLHRLAFAIAAGASMLAAIAPAFAQSVAPGHTINFTVPDSGSRHCRTGGVSFTACTSSLFVGTGWNTGAHRVRALIYKPPPATANPASYAQGSLHNRFTVSGTPGHWVNAQISANYDINPAQMFVFGNSYSEVTLMLEVRDVTNGSGFPITSHTLYELRRDNTQGVTDIASGFERQIKPGETGHFDMMLATGRTYQLSFTLEVMGGAFLGATESRATATWNRLSVTIDEDEVELIDDLAIALQQHDQDIKSRLDHVDEQLGEIKSLLLTPQGKRPGWNDKPH